MIVNSKFDFEEHIDTIYKKAKRKINLVLRPFTLQSPDFIKFVWKFLIQGVSVSPLSVVESGKSLIAAW